MQRRALVLVLLVAAGLRLYGLEVQSLWHDELFVRYAAQQPTLGEAIAVGAVQDVHPPGFVALMYVWIRLAGSGEAMLRLPSALAGIAAVAWLYRLGSRWLSPREGLVAAALAAVAWCPVYYSQEARPYALLLAGSIGLVDVVTTLVRSAPGRPRLAAAAGVWALMVALSYLHYFGALLGVLVTLAWAPWALRRWESAGLWLAGVGGALAAGLPWLGPARRQAASGASWMEAPDAQRLWEIYDALAGQHGLLAMVVAGVAAATWGYARLGQGGSVAGLLREAWRSPTALLIAWATVPALAAVAVSYLAVPVCSPRNLIIVLPALLLLAARALVWLDRASGRVPLASTLAVLGLALDLLVVRDHYRQPTRWQYREVAQQVAREDAAFFVSGAWHPSYFDAYLQDLGSPVRVAATARGEEVQRVVDAQRPAAVWVAGELPRRRRDRCSLALSGYTRSSCTTYVGWELYRFDRQPLTGEPPRSPPPAAR